MTNIHICIDIAITVLALILCIYTLVTNARIKKLEGEANRLRLELDKANERIAKLEAPKPLHIPPMEPGEYDYMDSMIALHDVSLSDLELEELDVSEYCEPEDYCDPSAITASSFFDDDDELLF